MTSMLMRSDDVSIDTERLMTSETTNITSIPLLVLFLEIVTSEKKVFTPIHAIKKKHFNRSIIKKGRDRMVVGFKTTYVISAYHQKGCEFRSHSWRGVCDTTLCSKVCQVLI